MRTWGGVCVYSHVVSTQPFSVAVAGASGYTGGELLRLIDGHPDLRLEAACAGQQAGTPVRAAHPQLATFDELVFSHTDPEILRSADVVFLALPHGQSAALAAQLRPEQYVVDLGADFRLESAAAWEHYYGGTHAGSWVYGLPELPQCVPNCRASTGSPTRGVTPRRSRCPSRRCSLRVWCRRRTSWSWRRAVPAVPVGRQPSGSWRRKSRGR